MIKFITFGNTKYSNSLKRIQVEAKDSGFFDEITIFSELDLTEEIRDYCQKNSRGYGYWIWKSYLVNKTISQIKDDDIIVYCDAGCTINKYGKERFRDYIDILNDNYFANISFQLKHVEKKYTKEDTFVHFDANELKETGQIVGGILAIRKNSHTSNLINIWYNTCIQHKNLLDDSPSSLKNDDSFLDHRHDQSIFSIIRKKYGTILLEDETYKKDSVGWRKEYPFWATRIK